MFFEPSARWHYFPPLKFITRPPPASHLSKAAARLRLCAACCHVLSFIYEAAVCARRIFQVQPPASAFPPPPGFISQHFLSVALRLAHRPAGFLFPRLPVLSGDPSDDNEEAPAPLAQGGDVPHGSDGEHHKMTCGQFVLVTFFIVAGGPTGIETVISSGGPFYGCIGLLIIPWLWCAPQQT